ncbi:MAG: CDP-diacylglycerol--glycerol-3-phosphate 3-phosphatidyltransferase [Bdellovibrionales bacterium RIFCSPHIGHO2_01_FULL_40_29]|nr:MAG: CDP-diacylglycerol--glycerol-3-phosphate 3-phosphatidyltransferase [Bdellovibrionales bacterium RIFCSPHIGHO2_01_FULL_40_29]OFZ34593.1 MAG: CDP-diacylglycerol--glycerol-3-phosphate 3-phosphatidyltransferase [Bdellovibrionales bacterium RIFCSPHIGHO2_02_FULL_40_15]
MSTLPLYLTISRIILVVPTIYFMTWDTNWGRAFATFLFIVASITDYYDGYYARKLNAVSNLGKFLDPVADKILVSSVLIMLVVQHIIDPWMVILFVARDTIIGGVRAAASANGVVIDAQTTGKWKAALQMVAIPLIILNDLHSSFPNRNIGYGLLWLSVLLSLKSGFDYCRVYQQGMQKAKTPAS